MTQRPSSRLRALAGWWLLSVMLASFASAPAHAWWAVLCIGDDGHVALERAAGPDCIDFFDDEGHAPPHGEQIASAPAGHCGDCLDLELTSADPLAPAKPLVPPEVRAGEPVVLPGVFVLPVPPRPALQAEQATRTAALPSPLLAARRTVVLIV